MVHVNLQKGCCARHLLEGLGPLKALLTILDGHVCTSHTFRHVVHILLQCLRVRWAAQHLSGTLLSPVFCVAEVCRSFFKSVLYYSQKRRRSVYSQATGHKPSLSASICDKLMDS